MDCPPTYEEWGKAAWNHLFGFYRFSNKNVKVFSQHFENVIKCKTVLLVPVTKAAFPMVNSSPKCNNELCHVFLQVKPGLRFGPGPFRVTFDPSRLLCLPTEPVTFLPAKYLGSWLKVSVSPVGISLTTEGTLLSHVWGLKSLFPSLWLRHFWCNH